MGNNILNLYLVFILFHLKVGSSIFINSKQFSVSRAELTKIRINK